MDDDEAEYIHRLLHPDFTAIERHFGHPVPAGLRYLYNDEHEITRTDFCAVLSDSVFLHILSYTPVDQSSLSFFEGFERYLNFADGYEAVYLIDPTEADPAIGCYYLDARDGLTGTMQPTGFTLSSFLAAARHTADGPVA